MKDFKEYKLDKEPKPNDFKLFVEYKSEQNNGFYFLNEEENKKVDELVAILEKEIDLKTTDEEAFIRKAFNLKKDEQIDEGFLSSILGGAAGFFIGPSIGKYVANALGVEKGILYDLLTSRLVTTALGAAVAKSITKKKS